jgi:hypothetical protein
LDYACENCKKGVILTEYGIVASWPFHVDFEQLRDLTGVTKPTQLDQDLDHLREIGLIHKGFEKDHRIDLAPTALALYLYVLCQGSQQSPREFFNVERDDSAISAPL